MIKTEWCHHINTIQVLAMICIRKQLYKKLGQQNVGSKTIFGPKQIFLVLLVHKLLGPHSLGLTNFLVQKTINQKKILGAKK